MPANQHLEWVDFDRFDGLWDATSPALMPARAAQVMSGCHPQPAGGLRAFFRPMAFSDVTGMYAANRRIVGIWPADSTGYYYVITATVDTGMTASTAAPRPPKTDLRAWAIYSGVSMSGWSAALGSPPFVATNHSSLDHVPQIPSLAQTTTAGTPGGSLNSCYIAVPYGNGSHSSLYSLSSGTMTKKTIGGSFITYTFATNHQNRVVASYEGGIIFSSPGTYDIPTGTPNQYINFDGSLVTWGISLPPSDLLIGTEAGGIYNVQGDLSDPTIRTLALPGSSSYGPQRPALTDIGVIVATPNGPMTVNGGGLGEPLGHMLDPKHWRITYPALHNDEVYPLRQRNLGGSFATSDGFVFARSDGALLNRTYYHHKSYIDQDAAGINTWVADNLLNLNGSLVLDTKAKAWFRSVHPDVADMLAPWIHVEDTTLSTHEPGILTIPSEELASTGRVGYRQQTSGRRAHVYEWRSAPLRSPDGREVELREVQIGLTAYTSPESTNFTSGLAAPEDTAYATTPTATVVITATNEDGVTATETLTLAGGTTTTLNTALVLKGKTVDITVKASTPHKDIEAPSIDHLRLGWTRGSHIVFQ